jgi:hypothetical protein
MHACNDTFPSLLPALQATVVEEAEEGEFWTHFMPLYQVTYYHSCTKYVGCENYCELHFSVVGKQN